jgi:two-component system response regulator CpxR
VELTSVEFSLLEALLHAAGQVVQRAELCNMVLGRNLTPFDRSIDVHVSSLRKKLGRTSGQQERIKAVRGLGYIYTLPTESLDSRETARTT